MTRNVLKDKKELRKLQAQQITYYKKLAKNRCVLKPRHINRLKDSIECKYRIKKGYSNSLNDLFKWTYREYIYNLLSNL